MKLRFREFELDTTARVLRREQVDVAVEPLVFECIELLASRPGELVRTAELRSRLWPDVRVAESAPRRVINAARRILGDCGDAQGIIRTRKGLGYVFVTTVIVEEAKAGGAALQDPLRAWPFVGRAPELELLGRWLDRPGSGGVCFVSGEAGAGKSSLLVRLRNAAPRKLWLLGQCHAGPERPAFWPFREIAQQLLAHPELRAHTLRLARGNRSAQAVIPELALEQARPPVHEGAPTHFESCEAWAGLLAALARVRPLHVILEDMHWAEDGSVWMLAALARAAQREPLHVFVTYRSESQSRALAELIARISGRDGVLDVVLGGLNQVALETLLAALEFPSATARVAAELLRLTAGNALFVRELVRHALATSGALSSALPASFGHIVAERIGLVGERTGALLELAAVLGSEFEIELLRAVADSPSQAVLLCELEPALRAGLLRSLVERPDRLAFSHALIPDALVRTLPAQRRQAHHLAALRALTSRRSAADCAALANHAFEAGSVVSADERRRLCERAGHDAFERLGFDRAALHLGRAVSLLAPDDDSAQAAELVLLWARARWHADDPEHEVAATLLSAVQRARRAAQPQLFAEAAIVYAVGDESLLDNRIAFLRPDAYALAEEAWQCLLNAAGGELEQVTGEVAHRLATVLCCFRVNSADVAHMQRWADLAQRLAPANPNSARRALLLAMRAVANPAESTARVAELAAHLHEPGCDVRAAIEGRIMLMGLHLVRAELTEYERCVRELELLAQPFADAVPLGRLGDRLSTYRAIPLLAQITLRVVRGQLAEAAERLAALPAEAARLGLLRSRRGNINSLAIWRWLAAYQGQLQVLEPLADEFIRADPSLHWLGVFLRLHFSLHRGALEVARAHYRELRDSDFRPVFRGQAQPPSVVSLAELGDACTHVGSEADALLLYERLAPHAMLVICDGTMVCWGAAARTLGALAAQLGRHVDAERHLQQALELNARLGHQPELVRTRFALARLYQRTGRQPEAAALLGESRAQAAAIGMLGFAHELPA